MAKGYEFIGATTITWIFRLIMMIVIFSVVYQLGATMINVISNVRLAQTNIYAASLLTNPDGIIKTEGGRAYPGVIDCKRLNEDSIKIVWDQGTFNEVAAKVTLFSMNGKKIAEAVYNHEYYPIWAELSKTNLFGSQSAFMVKKKKYVLLENCGDEKTGIIDIRLVRKKR